MALVRAADLEATSLQRQGELGLWASAIGQEAAQIGAGRASRPQDYVVPTYREHGVAWARGIDPLTLIGLYRGVTHCGWSPREISLHPYMIVLGAQTLHAVGYAMGIQRDGVVGTGDDTKDAAVLCFFGDGASSEGEVAESFTYAASTQAPVVFFCQNNQWAISVPTAVQTRVPLYQRSRGWGIPSLRVDGNDVLACLAASRMALAHARSGKGPFFVEAFTFRMAAHTTSDDPSRYRPQGEEQYWAERDPLTRLETYLRAQGLADDEFFATVASEADKQTRDLHYATRAIANPAPIEMFDHVYAEPHPQVEADREWYRTYLASFEAPEEGTE
ncbi:pyruvate dehydrogenase (acetyl-transferring) E1 component subunit alpha [Micrococcales bacterium 31B]|nr:pyruvate dehydrogenase (acetyl-transferring) E1 component subunit alpha [Micrococcales bacterium 31B]